MTAMLRFVYVCWVCVRVLVVADRKVCFGFVCMLVIARCTAHTASHETHTQVIARRALLTWIHSEVLLALSLATQEHEKEIAAQMPASSHPRPDQQNQPQQPKQQAAFSYNPTIHKLRLKPGLQLHMFVSQPPCGDASIITHAEGEAGEAMQTYTVPLSVCLSVCLTLSASLSLFVFISHT